MDKQKLKGTLISAAWEENEGVYHVRLEDVFEIIDQLDEPEKVVVPAFVGEWIDKCKDSKSLHGAMQYQDGNERLNNWMINAINQKTFARAWLDGYEVEQEKKYFIKDKTTGQLLGYIRPKKKLYWLQEQNNGAYGTFTKNEIESLCPELWPLAEEVPE